MTDSAGQEKKGQNLIQLQTQKTEVNRAQLLYLELSQGVETGSQRCQKNLNHHNFQVSSFLSALKISGNSLNQKVTSVED